MEKRARFVPRELSVDGSRFAEPGSTPTWRPAKDLQTAGQLAAASWQHNIGVIVREWLQRSPMTLTELAAELGESRSHFSGKLHGRSPITIEDLFRWPLAFDDITMLPPVPESIEELLPKPTRNNAPHQYRRLPKF